MSVYHRSRENVHQAPRRALYRGSGGRGHQTWFQGRVTPPRSLPFSRRRTQILSVKTQPHGQPRSVVLQDDWADSDVRKGMGSAYAVRMGF